MLKFVLLALLGRRSRHGYELKAAFEQLLGGTWRLNIGQVYTALTRLEQDGLIESEIVPQELLPDRKVYSLTERGEKELQAWLEAPATGLIRLRDEVFLKVILLVAGDGDGAGDGRGDRRGDAAADLIWRQRQAYLEAMADLEQLRRSEAAGATALLLEGLLLRMEADLRWLDRCEERLGGTR